MQSKISTKKGTKPRPFQWKLGISVAIIASALVMKTFTGDPESPLSQTIDRVVHGGWNYEEAVSAVGRVISGEEDVIHVFSGQEEKEKEEEKESTPREPVVDEKFYQSAPQAAENKTTEKAKTVPAVAYPTTGQINLLSAHTALSEQAEAEALSFEMSAAELADDTKAEPFRIPPPSYCSYEKKSISFRYATPLYGVITSKFGYRDHPIGGKASFHTGLDIAAASGTAVASFADGTVLEAAHNDVYGNYVLVEHSGGIRSFYGHNSKLVVKKGQKVKRGQKLCEVGTTGLSTGPHLHFEVRHGKIRLDPQYYISAERL